MSISSCEFIKLAARCILPRLDSENRITVLNEGKLVKITAETFKSLIQQNAYHSSPSTFYAERTNKNWYHVIINTTAPNSICFKASHVITRGLIPSEIKSLEKAYNSKECFVSPH